MLKAIYKIKFDSLNLPKVILIPFILFLATGNTIFAAEKKEKQPSIDPAVVKAVQDLGKAFSEIAAYVKPAVVSVYSESAVKIHGRDFFTPFGDDLFNEFFGRPNPRPRSRRDHPEYRDYSIPQFGMGSGMVLDTNGNILTNYHVVHNVDEIRVQLSENKILKAKLIGSDAKTDLAIIRVADKEMKSYPTITWGDSDAMKTGDIVIAIGAPFGLAQTVTHGIISATGRSEVGITDYENFLQTDAPINPGNSGGPLINASGEVIGMNSAIATNMGQSAGVGFSIPSNLIKNIIPRLIKGESIQRGELGVLIQNLSPELVKYFELKDTNGALVSQVNLNSPAEKAGIKVEDVITKFDGKPINDVRMLRNLVAETAPGKTVKIEIIRDKKPVSVTATIGKQTIDIPNKKNQDEGSGPLEKIGLYVETLDSDLASSYKTKVKSGAIVTSMEEGSPAHLAGFQVGDVILQANRKPVENVEDLRKIISQSKEENYFFLVRRQNSNIFINIQMGSNF